MRRKKLNQLKARREKRVRSAIRQTPKTPRLSVFRSHKHIYGQLIDDHAQKTLIAASSTKLKDKKMRKTETAKEVGRLLAEKAASAGVKKVVFDRGKYRYHGRVKALADGAREGGLEF